LLVLFHVFSMPMNGFFCKSPYFSPFSEAVPTYIRAFTKSSF